MREEEIRGLFMQGIDCSQVVAGYFSEKAGVEQETAWKMAAAFGGGMQCGETCGAVTGALMVIGLLHGHERTDDMEQKKKMLEKVQGFKQLFRKKYDSCICRELLGYDVSDPEDMKKILEKGLLFDFCPQVVRDTIDMLEGVV